MDKRKRQEILATPIGPELDLLVHRVVFRKPACSCGTSRDFIADTGLCGKCDQSFPALWSESHAACDYLLKTIKGWPLHQRNRFLDFLGDAISFRMKVGKIEPRQWIIQGTPEDICRAAVLVCAEKAEA